MVHVVGWVVVMSRIGLGFFVCLLDLDLGLMLWWQEKVVYFILYFNLCRFFIFR